MKILTFEISDDLFGIDITCVKEINRNIECVKVAGAEQNIEGVYNMRGHVVTVLGLHTLLGYTGMEKKQCQMCIVLKETPLHKELVGFLIDKPGDVVDVNGVGSFEEKETGSGLIKGVLNYEGNTIRLLDSEDLQLID